MRMQSIALRNRAGTLSYAVMIAAACSGCISEVQEQRSDYPPTVRSSRTDATRVTLASAWDSEEITAQSRLRLSISQHALCITTKSYAYSGKLRVVRTEKTPGMMALAYVVGGVGAALLATGAYSHWGHDKPFVSEEKDPSDQSKTKQTMTLTGATFWTGVVLSTGLAAGVAGSIRTADHDEVGSPRVEKRSSAEVPCQADIEFPTQVTFAAGDRALTLETGRQGELETTANDLWERLHGDSEFDVPRLTITVHARFADGTEIPNLNSAAGQAVQDGLQRWRSAEQKRREQEANEKTIQLELRTNSCAKEHAEGLEQLSANSFDAPTRKPEFASVDVRQKVTTVLTPTPKGVTLAVPRAGRFFVCLISYARPQFTGFDPQPSITQASESEACPDGNPSPFSFDATQAAKFVIHVRGRGCALAILMEHRLAEEKAEKDRLEAIAKAEAEATKQKQELAWRCENVCDQCRTNCSNVKPGPFGPTREDCEKNCEVQGNSCGAPRGVTCTNCSCH